MYLRKFIFIVLLLPWVSKALVAPDGTLALTDPSGTNGLNWDGVIPFVVSGPSTTSTMVAIDPYFLITAAHVADDAGNRTFTIGGNTFNQIAEFYHPTADLAIIQVDAPLPDYYQIYNGGYSILRPEVAMVGYGGVGTITPPTDYTAGSSGRGTKRWGTNKIDSLTLINSPPYSSLGMELEFDTTDSLNEAGAGVGDSGGGVFYNNGGSWQLAGIMTNVITNHATSPDSVLAVDVQEYNGWIGSVIPELPAWVMASGAVSLFIFIQRCRRR